MRVRSSRIISYAVGWAVLTVLAAGAVWWGLGPLLAPIMQVQAAPTQSPAQIESPSPSPTPSATASPKPRPSSYEGWQLSNGVFTQTFDLEAGKATVRIVGGRVELVSSQARNGYTVTPRQPSPDRLVLEFYNGTHFYVLDAMWWENRPYSKLTQVS